MLNMKGVIPDQKYNEPMKHDNLRVVRVPSSSTNQEKRVVRQDRDSQTNQVASQAFGSRELHLITESNARVVTHLAQEVSDDFSIRVINWLRRNPVQHYDHIVDVIDGATNDPTLKSIGLGTAISFFLQYSTSASQLATKVVLEIPNTPIRQQAYKDILDTHILFDTRVGRINYSDYALSVIESIARASPLDKFSITRYLKRSIVSDFLSNPNNRLVPDFETEVRRLVNRGLNQGNLHFLRAPTLSSLITPARSNSAVKNFIQRVTLWFQIDPTKALKYINETENIATEDPFLESIGLGNVILCFCEDGLTEENATFAKNVALVIPNASIRLAAYREIIESALRDFDANSPNELCDKIWALIANASSEDKTELTPYLTNRLASIFA